MNGEGIFGTRPWTRAEGETKEGISVRFTQKQKENVLFVFLMEKPNTTIITFEDLRLKKTSEIMFLGSPIKFSLAGSKVQITLPNDMGECPVYTFKISPIPY
ncbi:MAG: alpha-L-fucosidase C-terminal domain-containing protein [Promethearchaeia archaeon]